MANLPKYEPPPPPLPPTPPEKLPHGIRSAVRRKLNLHKLHVKLGPLDRKPYINETFRDRHIVIEVSGRAPGMHQQNCMFLNCWFIDCRIELVNCFMPWFANCWAWATQPIYAPAVEVYSDTKANEPKFDHFMVNGYETAVELSGDIEGGYVKNPAFVGVGRGIVCNFHTWQPALQVKDGHINAADEAIIAPFAAQSVIRDTLIYHAPDVEPVLAPTDPWLRNRIKPVLIPIPYKDDDWRYKWI